MPDGGSAAQAKIYRLVFQSVADFSSECFMLFLFFELFPCFFKTSLCEAKALVAEVRGDWKMMADVFRCPRHNSSYGCCWACTVVPSGIADFTSEAAWRQPAARLSHWGFISRLLREGGTMSPFFATPGLRTSCFKFDWLHAADQGVSADFLGNLFWMFIQKGQEGNQADNCKALWLAIVEYYKAFDISDRLPILKLTMIRKKNGAPKLRCKGAEARGLIRFAAMHSNMHLNDAVPIEHAAKQAAKHLLYCYELLTADSFHAQALKENAIKFLLLYSALQTNSAAPLWKLKPKHHLFAELCTEGSNPSLLWTYRDEDFGGYLASSSRRRGGMYSAYSVAFSVLSKFRSKEEPVMRL